MTFERDPPRLRTLRHELPSELTDALDAAAEERAEPAELAAVAARLDARLVRRAGRVLRSSAPPRPRRGPVVAVALTFTLGAVAGVVASSGVFVLLRAPAVTPPALVPPPASVAARAGRPALPRAASEVAPEPGYSAAPSPRPPREIARASPSVSGAEASAAAPATPAVANFDELALLGRAQAALRGDPAQALALANEHAARFTHGSLAQEREVVAIDALLRLGRRAEAVGRALRFHEQFPGSVHARRIDVLLGEGAASGDHK